jgi:dTDP-glucose 4,6-dehydratase
VEVARCDIVESVPGATFEGADAVMHLAGELSDSARMHPVNVLGTQHVLEAAHAVPVWLQLSSIGVYGARGRGTITEATKPTPRNPYERSKLEGDALVCQHRATTHHALLRPSIVYGPGMRSTALRSLAAAVRRHRFAYFGPRGAVAPYVHVDDVVSALIWLLDRSVSRADGPRASGAYNLSNDVTLESFVESLARAVHAEPPTLRLPLLVGRAATLPSRLTRRWPFTRDRLGALTSRVRYPTKRLTEELGWAPQVPHERGLRELFASEPHG